MLACSAFRATEWEDDVLFDADDPDFEGPVPETVDHLCSMVFRVPPKMSVASVQQPSLAELCPLGQGRSHSVSSSLSDLVSPGDGPEPVLTIEELRAQLGSCFTCGVSWSEQHVSLDCGECGGYAMQRPCPLCEGRCGDMWKRDLTMSHACSKARWEGRCGLNGPRAPLQVFPRPPQPPASAVQHPRHCAATAQLAQELCTRLEKLSASS